jgi:hypothetical protein
MLESDSFGHSNQIFLIDVPYLLLTRMKQGSDSHVVEFGSVRRLAAQPSRFGTMVIHRANHHCVCRPWKRAEPFDDICANTMHLSHQRRSLYHRCRYHDFSRASVGGLVTCGPRDSECQDFPWHEARVVARRQFNSVHRASAFQTLPDTTTTSLPLDPYLCPAFFIVKQVARCPDVADSTRNSARRPRS